MRYTFVSRSTGSTMCNENFRIDRVKQQLQFVKLLRLLILDNDKREIYV